MLVPYSGGPIIHCPQIYTSFWGPAWSDPAHTALANQLNQFHADLVASQFMNVLTQYGMWGSGAFIRATFVSAVPGVMSVSDYQNIIQDCINAGAFPEPQDPHTSAGVSLLMIFLDENTIINGGGRELNFPGAPDIGFHDSFTTAAGHPCVYAFTAYSPDYNFGTVVASHEFAEACTDPLYDAWTPDHAFHEIGDYCEGTNGTITVSGRTWTVQAEWDDTNNTCSASAPSPIPALTPGPGAAGALQGEVRGRGPRLAGGILPYERLLPLPPLHVDLATKTARMQDQDVYAYGRKVFHPLRHEHLFQDFPGFLRRAADMLEARQQPAAPATEEPRRAGSVQRS